MQFRNITVHILHFQNFSGVSLLNSKVYAVTILYQLTSNSTYVKVASNLTVYNILTNFYIVRIVCFCTMISKFDNVGYIQIHVWSSGIVIGKKWKSIDYEFKSDKHKLLSMNNQQEKTSACFQLIILSPEHHRFRHLSQDGVISL